MKPRLFIAACFLLLSIVLAVAARQMEGAARGLVIGAVIAGVIALGAVIAVLLAVASAATEELEDRFPVVMPPVYFALAFGAILLFGGFMVWIAWHGWSTGEVATIARRSSSTIRRLSDPFAFWASMLFHLGAGMFVLLSAISIAVWRWRRHH